MSEDGGIMLDGRQVASTQMCPHCGAHFEMVKGSGTRRAWCTRCAKVTCGKKECDACIPLEARFEYVEGRKTKYDAEIKELVLKGAALL